MSHTGQDIVDEVRSQLNDEDVANLRWTDAELLRFVNAAERQIVIFLPEANIIQLQFEPVRLDGARQTLPANGIKFIEVRSNFDNENSIEGPVIRYVEMDAMDSLFPQWNFIFPSAANQLPNVPTVEDEFTFVHYEHYMHDPREPKVFYLYPAPEFSTSQDINLVYSALPSDKVILALSRDLGDEYQNATVDYVIYRALSKDNRYGVDDEKRRALWDMFKLSLGMKLQQELRVDSTANAPPEGP